MTLLILLAGGALGFLCTAMLFVIAFCRLAVKEDERNDELVILAREGRLCIPDADVRRMHAERQ